jgi:D-lactate dehydrogenase
VVIDTASCATAVTAEDLTLYDPARFVAEVLLPRLPHLAGDTLLLHPTCSEEAHGGRAHLAAIPGAVIPATTGCCGMAGDRGWLVPELTAAATAREAAAVHDLPGLGTVASASCGLAMTTATGREYRHLFSRLADRLPLD